MAKIAVIGTGYVGLVSGVCFAELGHEVTCVDKQVQKIEQLNAGQSPIFEPGLDDMIARHLGTDRLTFTTSLASAVAAADAVFIAVGTPCRPEDGSADLRFVVAAAKEIGTAMTGYTVVVTKSTVPVGTNRKVADEIRSVAPLAHFDIASNPEFLREGAAIRDFMQPDRIVVGAETDAARAAMAAIYAPLTDAGYPLVMTRIETAELTKYAANAFLATKITFINEIAELCERAGADVEDLAEGIGLDTRIGRFFLQAGPGFGGSCFPKDTSALAHTGAQFGVPMQITEQVIAVNNRVKHRMVGKVFDLCDGSVAGKTVAVLGVTFKADTDDMRDSPALVILPRLMDHGAKLRVYDPQGRKEGERMLPGVTWSSCPYEAAERADVIVVLTEWDVFRSLDLKRIATVMSNPRMADLRNLYDQNRAREAGFHAYEAIGSAGFRKTSAEGLSRAV